VLTAEEAGELPHSIETDTVVEPRDRALIGVMVFTLARVSAACGLQPERRRRSRKNALSPRAVTRSSEASLRISRRLRRLSRAVSSDQG